MTDPMLTELYRRVFDEKREAERIVDGEPDDRRRGIAISKNKLLAELIDFQTELIRKE